MLRGDPTNEGPYTVRMIFPPNFKTKVHKHPRTAEVTIIKGQVFLGFGEFFDEKIATSFTAGSFFENAPNTWHYTYTKDASATVKMSGMGPWEKTDK